MINLAKQLRDRIDRRANDVNLSQRAKEIGHRFEQDNKAQNFKFFKSGNGTILVGFNSNEKEFQR